MDDLPQAIALALAVAVLPAVAAALAAARRPDPAAELRAAEETCMSVLRRVTGMGSAGSLALALLAGGCVLAATAGPREAQATRTRALQQTMNGVPPLDKTIVVSSNWTRLNTAIQGAPRACEYYQNLTPADR